MVSSKHFLPLYSTSSITNQFRGYSGIGSLPVPVPPPCSTLWRTTFSCHAKSREMDWKRFLSSIERNTKTIIVKYISDRFSNKRVIIFGQMAILSFRKLKLKIRPIFIFIYGQFDGVNNDWKRKKRCTRDPSFSTFFFYFFPLHVRFAIGEQWWRNRVILEDAYEMNPSFTSPSHSSSKKSPEDSFLSISILWIPSEVLPRKWAL